MAQDTLKIACISDTHDIHYPTLPEVDAVIHAGDITLGGGPMETRRFLEWFHGLKIKHKIFIGGNHDAFLEKYHGAILEDYPSITMLLNSSYDLEGYKVWGSPVSPAYGRIRAFAKEREDIFDTRFWERIPMDADIVVTHGPAAGVRDSVRLYAESLGDPMLLKSLSSVAPIHHICGHIHGGRGSMLMKWESGKDTYFHNVAVLNEAYHPYNYEPIVIELPRKQPETVNEEDSRRDSGVRGVSSSRAIPAEHVRGSLGSVGEHSLRDR